MPTTANHRQPLPAASAAITRDAPAFDFYPERWLVGVATLSDAEQLAYLRLLCHEWMLGDEGLPGDVAALKRLAGKGVTPALLAKFPAHADGRRRNGRLEIIRQEQRERIASRRLGAALTHARRYGVAALGAEERALLEQTGRVVNGVLVAPGVDGEVTPGTKGRRRPQMAAASGGRVHAQVLEEGEADRLAVAEGNAGSTACADADGVGGDDADEAAGREACGAADAVGGDGAGIVASRDASKGAGSGARGVAGTLPPPTTHRSPPTDEGTDAAGGRQGLFVVPGGDGRVSTPAVETVRQWAQAVMVPPECAEVFWNDHEARGWSDKTGQRIQNFRAAFNGFATRWKSVQMERAARGPRPLVAGQRSDTANRPGRYG